MNSKRRCKHCGDYERVTKGFKSPCGLFFCNRGHAAKWAIEKHSKERQKESRKKRAKQKKDFYRKDVKTRKKAAKDACHKYIRERDKRESCICCDRPLGKNHDAGHFLESGNNSKLRYDEDNIHSQSVYCNRYKGGDSGDYEKKLRVKIGDKRVDFLLMNRGCIVKRTANDYSSIEQHYKNKLRELKMRTDNE